MKKDSQPIQQEEHTMNHGSHDKTNCYYIIHRFKRGLSIVENFVYEWFSELIGSSQVPVYQREGTVD